MAERLTQREVGKNLIYCNATVSHMIDIYKDAQRVQHDHVAERYYQG